MLCYYTGPNTLLLVSINSLKCRNIFICCIQSLLIRVYCFTVIQLQLAYVYCTKSKSVDFLKRTPFVKHVCSMKLGKVEEIEEREGEFGVAEVVGVEKQECGDEEIEEGEELVALQSEYGNEEVRDIVNNNLNDYGYFS